MPSEWREETSNFFNSYKWIGWHEFPCSNNDIYTQWGNKLIYDYRAKDEEGDVEKLKGSSCSPSIITD